MAGRGVSGAVEEKAGQGTAFDQDSTNRRLSLQSISQHISLCTQLFLSAGSVSTKLLSQRK